VSGSGNAGCGVHLSEGDGSLTSKLDRVIVRLHRADGHLGLFDAKSGISGSGQQGFGVRRETNDDGSKHIYFGVVEDRLAETLSCLVSDCLHNLRSALDNLVFRLAELNLSGPVPLNVAKDLSFPICSSPAAFQQAISRHRISGISMAARALVERFQPYNRVNTPFRDALTMLSDLQNLDKHRFLVRIAVDVGDYLSHASPLGYQIEAMVLEGLFLPEGLTNDAPLAAFFVDPPDRGVDVEFDSHPCVLFDGGSARGTDPSGLLHLIRTEVGEIVSQAEQLPECL
jgi:hypothetical protein